MEIGRVFRRVGKEQSGPCVGRVVLFDLRSGGPWGWLRFSGSGQIKQAVEKNEASLSVVLSFAFSVYLCWCLFLRSRLSFASLDVPFFFCGMAVRQGGELIANSDWAIQMHRETPFSLIFQNFNSI